MKNRGFTLVEILIVIALIGTLATWVISLINPAAQFRKARDSQRKADIRQIQTALELYRADHGFYPDSIPSCGAVFSSDQTVYLQKMPCDPSSTLEFFYGYTKITSTTYSLDACLENVNDPQRDQPNNTTYCSGGTTDASYTVYNP